MDRRKSLKVIALGSLSAGALLSACKNEDKAKSNVIANDAEVYGRTPEEAAHNAKLMAENFFTAHEMATLTILCDMIVPADSQSGSASDAEVPAFIEFTMKDQPKMQIPMRGGLRWLDVKSYKLFNKSFITLGKEQRIELLDLIAYPEKASRENTPGVVFFNTVRNLTATGFFTSKIGIEDLQYMGNTPNAWDGVPEDVLKQYDLKYDAKTIAQCLKSEDRGKIMTWEE